MGGGGVRREGGKEKGKSRGTRYSSQNGKGTKEVGNQHA